MTRYLTTSDPDGAHVLETEVPSVQAPGDGEGTEFFEVGYTNDGDYGTSALVVEEDLVVTEIGEHRTLPPRDVAPEQTEQSTAGRITGGISNAHPDLTFGEAQPADGPVAEPAPGEPPPTEPVAEPTPSEAVAEPLAQPAGNATAEEWRAYATTAGMDSAQADLMGRDALKAHYSGEGVPLGNATGEEWREYAVAMGMDPAEADSLGRDELRARFGG